MDLYTLDAEFNQIGYVEVYDSAIWALRYAEYGDFELHVYPDSELANDLWLATYILDKETRTAMFIEEIEMTSDADSGSEKVFKGRSLETILMRRIIWEKKTVTGKIQNIISTLLTENIIDPKNSDGTAFEDRRISNFIFQPSSDPRLDDYKIETSSPLELEGDNLYDVIKYLCDLFDVGFRVTLNTSNQFVFELYCGKILDGSIRENKIVMFSPKMENLASSRYYQSSMNYKNITQIVSTYEFKATQDNDKDDDQAASAITASTPSWVVCPRGANAVPTNGLKLAVHFNKKIAANATLSLNEMPFKPLYFEGRAVKADDFDSGVEAVMKYNSTGNGRWDLTIPKEGDPPVVQSRVLVVTDDIGDVSGLSRREIFTDANSITTEDGMTPQNYAESMRLLGYGTLRDNSNTTEVDGESIPGVNYIFGKDFNIGDLVKVSNEFGITISARITEYVQTIDENGESACPTFSSVYS